MHKTCAPQLTTVELIDALEARIAAIRSQDGAPERSGHEPAAASALREELERSAVSATDLAKAVGVPNGDLDAWMDGGADISCWVLAATRLFALLTPSARRKLLTSERNGTRQRPEKTHPFSRIEDL